MRAITIWQPWASLIAVGAKSIETRSWPTRYRGPLLIHAAKRWDAELDFQARYARDKLTLMLFRPPSEAHERAGSIPIGEATGKVVAVATLADCRPMAAAPDPINAEFGHFGPGRWGWVLSGVRPLPSPIPWRGAQGLWDVPAELQQAVQAALPPIDSATPP
jgi:hypothetical protein